MAIEGVKFLDGFEGEDFLVFDIKEKRIYDENNKPTNAVEGINVFLKSLKFGEVTLLLTPFSEEKKERAISLYGSKITVADIANPVNCRFSVYEGRQRVTITAADILPTVDL